MLLRGLSNTFTHALVRPPSANYSQGLTQSNLGAPNLDLARRQHDAYCKALAMCGLTVQVLEPDDAFPDSTFVEDTALLFPEGGVLCCPGAPSRFGEVAAIERVLDIDAWIEEPGTVDGGDVCFAEREVFIGISKRTNRAGAEQLADLVKAWGYVPLFIDLADTVPERLRQWVTPTEPLLHLKSGMSYLGNGLFVLERVLAGCAHILGERDTGAPRREYLIVEPEEAYAANCIRINDSILVASGFPRFVDALKSKVEGLNILQLDMSEFQKMDGGLSCLSLRW